MVDRLEQSMSTSSRSCSHGALLFIDLDNFNLLNDTLGHDMGDLLLKQAGQRLVASVRAGDTTARLGGDEFVAILANLSTAEGEAAAQTEFVGEKIIAALNQTYQLKDITYHITPSIGATLFMGHHADREILLKQADLAMYRAKDTGRNTLRFFDPDPRPELAHLSVAVNISAHQFHQPDFVEQVLAVLQKTGANPQYLKLELTESLLVSNVEEIIEKMVALKDRGVAFSLDDFGTGYSSLAYLKRMPLDQFKIDQSFVRDVLIDPNDAAIAKTIIALAQSLGLGVIAEGVETEMQRDFLADSGCDAYQGYFFSRPLPLDEFEVFARQ